jgi:general secretion pathway protein D
MVFGTGSANSSYPSTSETIESVHSQQQPPQEKPSNPPQEKPEQGQKPAEKEPRQNNGGAQNNAKKENQKPGPAAQTAAPVASRGNQRPAPARPNPPQPAERRAPEPGIKLNFSNLPIDRVISSVMQELGYSYVIDPAVQGTVNIYSMREIPKSKLFSVLEQLLKMNGQAIVKQEDYYVIVPINQSPTIPHGVLMTAPPGEQEHSQPATESQRPGPKRQQQEQQAPPEQRLDGPIQVVHAEGAPVIHEQGVITYIIPLNFMPSEQMIQMFQAFLSPGAQVVDFAPANMVIVTDYPDNVSQILNLVHLLDTRYMDVNQVDLIPIRFNEAADVAEDLAKIFSPGDTATGVRIVAIERLNSLLVVTRSTEVLQDVKTWLERLDAPSTSSNMKTFVYQVENNTAVQIAQILGELYQDGSGLPSSASGEEAQFADATNRQGALARNNQLGGGQDSMFQRPTQQPGFVDNNRNSRAGMGRDNLASGDLGMRELGPALSKSSQSQIRAIFAGNVKIVVNEFNNSLIIQGSEADIQFILETVKQLDTLPRQVVIEASIFSVALNDDLSFGVNAFLQAAGAGEDGGGPATTGSIDSGQLTLATRALVGQERELKAVITALSSKTDVEVVETPRVLALDGTPSSINVGAEVPVTSASFGNPLQSGTTNFVNSIQFRPTGTTLLIVPRISASGIVTMDLVLEVSSATGPALTPTINRTYLQSTFIVRDGQTVAIAGLISDSYDVSKKRVPVIGDIPIIGAAFGVTERKKRRAELVIMITPTVIRSLPTATELTLEFKRALKKAYNLIDETERERENLINQRRLDELQRMLEERNPNQ